MIAASRLGDLANLFALLIMAVLLIGAVAGKSAMLFVGVIIVVLIWVVLALILVDDKAIWS
jgi:hypothetical protein